MGKRGNGEGSITRRKDGLYIDRYTVQTSTGAKRKTLYARHGRRSQRSSRRLWPTGKVASPTTLTSRLSRNTSPAGFWIAYGIRCAKGLTSGMKASSECI